MFISGIQFHIGDGETKDFVGPHIQSLWGCSSEILS